jgi:hypothetical protein
MKLSSKLFSMFQKPSPKELAAQELLTAQHALLEALTGVEWARSMVAYNETRIERLQAYLKS